MFKHPKVVSIDVVKRESKEPLSKRAIPLIPTKTLPRLSDEVGENCVPDADSGFDAMYALICKQCGEPVEVNHPLQ